MDLRSGGGISAGKGGAGESVACVNGCCQCLFTFNQSSFGIKYKSLRSNPNISEYLCISILMKVVILVLIGNLQNIM